MSGSDPRGATEPDADDAATTSPDGSGTGGPDGGGPDGGRHAVQRPAPAPPPPTDDDPTPVAPPPADPGARSADAGIVPGPGAPADDGTAAPERSTAATTPQPAQHDDLFPDPHAPRTPHALTHVLGTVLGLVLAPFAVALLLLGQSRVLEVQVDGWDASLELLGIVLVSGGALLTAGLLVLGLWTAAVPTAAGLVIAVVGGLQLYAPGIARAATLDLAGSDAWDLTLKQATVAGTSGTTLTVGLLVLTGGVAIALARRRGIHLGAFRERNRPVPTAAPARSTVREADNQD